MNASEARFTKGPWQRSGVRVKLGAEDCLQVGPDGFSIAFLPIGKRPNEQAGAIADAILIAAAPDLLEALQEVFVIGDRLVDDVYGYEFVQKAKAAINKATGK